MSRRDTLLRARNPCTTAVALFGDTPAPATAEYDVVDPGGYEVVTVSAR